MRYYKTHILHILVGKKILDDRLIFLFSEDTMAIKSFLLSIYSNKDIEPWDKIKNVIPVLLKYGFISKLDQSGINSKCSLMFTNVINFELTYSCNHQCPHCLQANIIKNQNTQISLERVKESILQAYISGICSYGINYTGGEVLGNRGDFFEILEFTQSLKIPYRINTNSWWARKSNFLVCGIFFSNALAFVEFLKSKGLFMFAFSFDERYHNDIGLADDLIETINLCEIVGLHYQIIFTGIESKKVSNYLSKLRKIVAKNLNYLIPVSMEMVDIGNATDLRREIFNWQSNMSVCESKGFYRPQFLHISPYGEVRTCIYANGLCNVGNLTTSSFTDLINEFPKSDYNSIFSDTTKQHEIFNTLVTPYLAIYKPIIHECTRNIILAKTLMRYAEISNSGLQNIHETIATEMNLLA
ncbi:MAG: hypothetical protein NTW16_11465 [Bacteroidetes bacterium]|nr:hypothetical protein [Bacteroidota bacterium]